MVHRIAHSALTLLESPLSRTHEDGSLQQQLYQRIRRAISEGRIFPGTRLPGTRRLSASLDISRNTVIAVFNQLVTEGLIISDTRGSRVAEVYREPDEMASGEDPDICSQAESLQQESAPFDMDAAFFAGTPALSQFPLSIWRRTEEKVLRTASYAVLGYSPSAGEPLLRKAIASHLSLVRGVQCTEEQVIITSGFHKSMSVFVRELSVPGETAWVEDPGYRGAYSAFKNAGLFVHPVPVDKEGINPKTEDWKNFSPRLIYITPNHQYPTGGVLGTQRRLELMNHASRHNAWIIEDDYGSELRHSGIPTVAMQGLRRQAPVIYIGSFSKTMFPALRIGYLVVPKELLNKIEPILRGMTLGGSRVAQLTLAEFIESGRYGKHLSNMRQLYHMRQIKLLDVLRRYLLVPYAISGEQFGIQLTLHLPTSCPDYKVAEIAKKNGMSLIPLSSLAINEPPLVNGLVIGYGNTSPDYYDSLVRKLSIIVNDVKNSG